MKKKGLKTEKHSPEDIDQVKVRLKPIFGIRPGKYLLILYSFILVLILFLLLFLPGIRNNGAEVEFNSSPEGAAVYLDGIRQGATPLIVFVPSGTKTIRMFKPHFSEKTFEEDIPGRVFGSLFFPKKHEISVELELTEEEKLFEDLANTFSSWAMIGNPHSAYQFPPILDSFAADVVSSKIPFEVTDPFYENLLFSIENEFLFRKYVKSLCTTLSREGIFSSYQISRFLIFFNGLIKRYQGFQNWLYTVLPENQALELQESSWYGQGMEDYASGLDPFLAASGAEGEDGRVINFFGIPFSFVSSENYVMGLPKSEAVEIHTVYNILPHLVSCGNFYIMQREVTKADFARFIGEVPKWAPDNKAALLDEGLVGESYLADWQAAGDGELPLVNVSWYAASAYAEWLDSQLPPSFEGWEIRLPRASEWELAVKKDKSVELENNFLQHGADEILPSLNFESGEIGLKNMMGNAWEWCYDSYFPARYRLGTDNRLLNEGFDLESELISPLRVVRGGSWLNSGTSILPISQGSQPPSWTNPFLGFRLVIAEKQ